MRKSAFALLKNKRNHPQIKAACKLIKEGKKLSCKNMQEITHYDKSLFSKTSSWSEFDSIRELEQIFYQEKIIDENPNNRNSNTLEWILEDQKKTFKLNSNENYLKASSLIWKAKNVLICGFDINEPFANILKHHMNSMGILVNVENSLSIIKTYVANLNEDDVVIAISYSGKTFEMNEIVEVCKNYKVKIVAITAGVDEVLGKNANVVLPIAETCSSIRALILQTEGSLFYIILDLVVHLYCQNYELIKDKIIKRSMIF